ncbi:Auxin-responsive protein [Melia azedarach]|uniref:Auxin-responsive protein n=1 Tax=Melia azedarach TaxID=155640 RepID=A0ACC1X9T0_MELAZ|nr:Auxin-responsive protein [Melia azedarach]
MEEYPQLFNLISKDKEWLEEKKLELRLGPPGGDQSPVFLGYNNSSVHGAKRVFMDTMRSKGLAGKAEDFPKPCSSRVAEILYPDKKSCSCLDNASVTANTAMINGSNKRTEVAPVVGWPPIRSFRKNLASTSSSKLASKLPNETSEEGSAGKSESFKKNLFVKINMEGVPIGRKINLSAYNSYEELSFAIDELFKGLIAVQRDPSAARSKNIMQESKIITNSLAKSDEYTLLYEDNEGDRMLVGDVPWHMFVSTVKKLLVLKSSELSTLRTCSIEQEKSITQIDSAVEIGRRNNFSGVISMV